jgi:uncharacterized protein (TIGR02597 family)
MKNLLSLSFAVLIAHSSFGQNATTTPVGAMTYTFPAAPSGDVTTYFTLPLLNDPVFTGSPSAVADSNLTFSNATWTTNEFVTTPPSFFVRVMSGLEQGRILKITGNTANTLTVSTNDDSSVSTPLTTGNFSVTTSDSIELIQADTLASLFGDNVTGNLTFGGASRLGSADTVTILNKSSNTSVAYWFNTSTLVNQWRPVSGTAANMNNTPVFPDSTMVVVRRKGRTVTSFPLLGRVSTVKTLIKSIPTRAVPSSLIMPVDVQLSSLQIAGSSIPLGAGWTKANRLGSADTITINNASTGKTDTYYQRTDNTWRLSTDANTDQSSVTIPAGSVISFLERTNGLTGSAAFFCVSLPYTLN